jgi:prophage antirepressor-like protein
MNNQIIPFDFENHDVRVVMIDGAEWWVGRDICEALGFTNHNKAISDHCKGVTKRYPLETAGGIQEVRIISEGDVFRLIVNSRLPEARRFEKWLFETVLPQIRKTGAYSAAGQIADLAAVNALLRESVPRVKLLVSENNHLRQTNRLYEEVKRLREQLARKNTPLTESEKRQILACAAQQSVAEIARLTNRSKTAIRRVIGNRAAGLGHDGGGA